MSGIVQVPLSGFLGLFQLKTMGKLPSPMGDQLSPTLDLLKWYMVSQATNVAASRAGVSALTNYQDFTTPAQLQVPDNEWWFVHSYRITAALAANDLVAVIPSYRLAGTGADVFGGAMNASGPAVAGSTAVANNGTWDLAENWWLPPGSALGYAITHIALTSASITLNGRARFTRLPI